MYKYSNRKSAAILSLLFAITKQKSCEGMRCMSSLIANSKLFETGYVLAGKHMGEPLTTKAILQWLNKMFGSIPFSSCEGVEKPESKKTAAVAVWTGSVNKAEASGWWK